MAGYTPNEGYAWNFGNAGAVGGMAFTCGYCGNKGAPVNSMRGQVTVNGAAANRFGYIHFCPVCYQPNYFSSDGKQIPAVRLGATLQKVPADGLKQIYDEARDCSAAGAYTACVMVCRKILMNLAVREGAERNKSFKEYVDYLVDKNFVPPKGKGWVDKIRDKGNEAIHEIHQQGADDAKDIMHLVEMLLRFNYEITP